MRSVACLVTLLLALVLGACAPEEQEPAGRTATSAGGLYNLALSTNPDPIPFSELFELDVTLTDASKKAVTGATLAVKVTMPAHGHGMQTSPQVSETGDGHYKVSGLKFHMRGEWTIEFAIQGAPGSDTVSFVENYE